MRSSLFLSWSVLNPKSWKNRIIIHVGSGLQCFECNAYNDHICSKTGVQEGQIINCAKDETACSKSVGGKIV